MQAANFDIQQYEANMEVDKEDYVERYDEIEEDLLDLVIEFDLTGDRLISPEEFYNIIMARYD